MLGYLGQIQKEQLNSPQYKGYGQSDLVGRAGLELQYEKYLRGTNGEQKFIVNANGDTIRALGAIPPKPGDTLDLTIDSKVQKAVEDELVRGLENARNQVDEAGGKGLYLQAPAGAAVVMDVQTGGVVAMASWPTYDPSWFVKGLTRDESRYLFKSAQAPSINRTIGLTYKPGSIFKPIVALTAEKEGVACFSSYYACPATWTAPGDTSGAVFTNWSTVGPRAHVRSPTRSRSRATPSSTSSGTTSGHGGGRTRSGPTTSRSSAISGSGASTSPPGSTSRPRRAA